MSDELDAPAPIDGNERLAEITAVMNRSMVEYRETGLDKEHLALLQAGHTPQKRAVPAPTRLKEIVAVMNRDIDEYRRLGLDKEHIAILKAQLEKPQPEVTGLDDPGRKGLAATSDGRELLRKWDAKSEALFWLTELRNDARTMMREVGDDLADTFDELPQRTQIAIFAELATMPRNDANPAPPPVVAEFQQTDVGRDLVREWGRDAAVHIGRVRASAARIFRSLGEVESAFVKQWFDSLDPRAIRAMVRRLGR